MQGNVNIYRCFTLNGFHESFSGAMAGVSCVLQSNALNTVSIGLNQDVNEKRASNCMSLFTSELLNPDASYCAAV